MWQFLTSVLEHAGFTALLYVLTLIGGFFIIRALWKRVHDAEEKAALVDARIEKVRLEEHTKRSEMRAAFQEERTELERRMSEDKRIALEELNRQLIELVELRRGEAMRYADRIDDLQEKRVTETGAVVEKVVRHVESTKNGLEKLSTGLDVLIELTKR